MTATLVSIKGTDFGLDSARNPLSKERHMGKLIFASPVGSALITNTTVETAFDQIATIKANTLFPGSVIKIKYQGIAPSTNATDTLTVRLYYGGLTGVLLFIHAATDVATNDIFWGEYELIVRVIGSAGSIIGLGFGKSVTAAEGAATMKDDILGATSVDTTVDKDIVVSAAWSVASAANQVRLSWLTVEQW